MTSPFGSSVTHRIDLDGNTVTRDGRAVKIIRRRGSFDVRIGCTWVSISALRRLLELSSDHPDIEIILQAGDE